MEPLNLRSPAVFPYLKLIIRRMPRRQEIRLSGTCKFMRDVFYETWRLYPIVFQHLKEVREANPWLPKTFKEAYLDHYVLPKLRWGPYDEEWDRKQAERNMRKAVYERMNPIFEFTKYMCPYLLLEY